MLKTATFIWALLFVVPTSFAQQTIKFGLHQNKPLNFTDTDAQNKGLVISIINHIADKEDWSIEYIPCIWSECLAKLEKGEIDLLSAIGYTEKRKKIFDFTTIPVITNWGLLAIQPNSSIQSILDLEGKTIAVMKRAGHTRAFKKLINDFNIDVTYKEVDDFISVFQLVDNKKVDAGVVNRLIALQFANDYQVVSSSIIFNPLEIRFAATKNQHGDKLLIIDRYLKALKDDPNSIYFQALNKWFGAGIVGNTIPAWLKWVALLLLSTIAFLVMINSALNYKVKKKHKHLTQKIAEHQLAEEKISRLNAELEQKVEARTLDLSQANKELEAFTYSVSHDLRSPLRSINGFSRAVIEDYEDKLDDTGKNYLNRIYWATERMGGLIDDLLNLSRISKRELKHTRVNMSELAQAIRNDILKSNDMRQINLSIAEHLMVNGDPRLLKIALENLLGNAVKYTEPKETANIEFGQLKHQEEIIFYIKDNGVGFDMKYVEKLFLPFQRLHSTQEFSGNGIGLSIVERIIKKHNGSIWVESSIDEGTTFYFKL